MMNVGLCAHGKAMLQVDQHKKLKGFVLYIRVICAMEPMRDFIKPRDKCFEFFVQIRILCLLSSFVSLFSRCLIKGLVSS